MLIQRLVKLILHALWLSLQSPIPPDLFLMYSTWWIVLVLMVFSIKWITIIQFSGELYWFLYWNLVQLLPSYTGNIRAHFIQVNQICFFMFICMFINTDSFRNCIEFILNHWFEFINFLRNPWISIVFLIFKNMNYKDHTRIKIF